MTAEWKSAVLSLGVVAPVAGGVGMGCEFIDVSPALSGALISAIFALFPLLHASFQTKGMDGVEKSRFFLCKKYQGSPLITIASAVLIFQFWEKLLGFVSGAAMGMFLASIVPDAPAKEVQLAIMAPVQFIVNIGALFIVFFVSRFVAIRAARHALALAMVAVLVSRALTLAIAQYTAFAFDVPFSLSSELLFAGVSVMVYAPIVAVGVWRGSARRDEFALVKGFRALPRDERHALLELAHSAPR